MMFGFGILTGLLVLPLVGAAFILVQRGDEASVASNARWAALITTVLTFALACIAWGQFDTANPGFQLVETHAWVSEAIALLHFQRFAEARSKLLAAAGHDARSPVVVRLRVVADSMLAVTDSVDARNRFVREGRAHASWTAPLVIRAAPERRRRPDAVQLQSRSAISAEIGVPAEVP